MIKNLFNLSKCKNYCKFKKLYIKKIFHIFYIDILSK